MNEYSMDYKHIINNIKQIRLDMKSQLPTINELVNEIIKRKIRDITEIERILDCLSGVITLDIGKKEYRKLLDYYKTINPKNAKCYEEFDKKYG